MVSDPLAAAIRRLGAREPLDAAAVTDAFGVIMRGEGSPAQLAALLVGLRVRGESPQEVAGVVEALRRAMVALPVPDPAALVDTCGTGGGSVTTFNISTAAALVAAGMGVRVAKHGNRSFTSRSGSADVLEALGVRIEMPPTAMAQVLAEAGVVFMYAPLMHPALRHVGPVRRELGIPTVMNMVGPLANPARAGRQVVGVAEAARVPLLAEALLALGSVHALVVHGAPGMDEISPLGPTSVMEVRDGALRAWEIDPEAHGLGVVDPAELAGETPAHNAQIIEEVLAGRGAPGAQAAVLLNAAAAVYVAGQSESYAAAVPQVRGALEGRVGSQALARLRAATQRYAPPPPA